MRTPIDLDANATVPPLPAVLSALPRLMATHHNPSAPHAGGRSARRTLDQARRHVATALGARDKDVFFTSGATEGNRWLTDAIVLAGQKRGAPLSVWVSPLEHPSVKKPLDAAHAEGLLVLSVGAVSADGALSVDDAFRAADVVCVTGAHNETGILWPLESILSEARSDAIVWIDASQRVARVGAVPARADAVVMSAHKIGGLAGAGAVALRNNGRKLAPPWAGSGQENGLRPGTEAIGLIAAMGEAAAHIGTSREAHAALAPVRDTLERALLEAWPGARVLGAAQERLPNTTAICLSGADGEALRMLIDTAGVYVGFGAACSALAPAPSPSLMALGLTAAEARATVRLSLAIGTTTETALEAAARLIPVGQRLLGPAPRV